MKVLHLIAGNLDGGAARGAYWLHLGLKKQGVDSKIITNSTLKDYDESIVSIVQSKQGKLLNAFRRLGDGFFTRLYKNRDKKKFSTGLVGFDFTKTREYKEADIIHLHWVNSGFVSIKTLAQIKKPIVWTIRDMWPMTGGCHYALECTGYLGACGQCPQLASKYSMDLSRFVYKRKMKYLPDNIIAVAISPWLKNTLKQSSLFKKKKVVQINNNINSLDFLPIEMNIAREIIGLTTRKKVILVGANNVADYYKGFDLFVASLKLLDNEKYFLLFFGNVDKKYIDDLGFEYKMMGYVSDNITLRLIYSSADVFVAPSVMEAFGKTLAEAMACETPVVCFDATGPKDIVTHKVDGYKAKAFELSDLANGIEWVVNCEKYNALCKNARKKVVEHFDSEVIAKRYILLYQDMLRKHKL